MKTKTLVTIPRIGTVMVMGSPGLAQHVPDVFSALQPNLAFDGDSFQGRVPGMFSIKAQASRKEGRTTLVAHRGDEEVTTLIPVAAYEKRKRRKK